MKREMAAIIWLSVGLITVTHAKSMKLFDIKSGKIIYKLSGSANIMGMKMQMSGIKRFIFDNYGARSLIEIKKTQKKSGMGGQKSEQTHTLTLVDQKSISVADFNTKIITKVPNIGASMLGGGNMKDKGLAMLKQMGGKKRGTDKVLGYTCDVWELMGTKQCIYKGVTLKVVSNVMGVVNREIATDIKFDSALSDNDFKLPDFPIKEGMGSMGSLSKSSAQAMQAPNAEDMSKMAEALKQMGAAMQKNGSNKQEITIPPQAQKQLQNALMGAMLPQMKQQILSQEKALRFAKSCLSNADSFKEAKNCEKKINKMMGERGEHIHKWDAKTKKETLHEIDRGLEGMACVKKAQTAQAIEQCMQ